VTEYADLASPELRLVDRDGELRLSGAFGTYLRPNGSDPQWSGRTYRVEVTVEAAGAGTGDWRPAAGSLELGSDRTTTTGGPEVSALRRAS
jgi:hypothetical protein